MNVSTVEILCVGNELLIGKTVNSNAHWLGKRATTLGLKVTRITCVADDVDEISTAFRESLGRKPAFILSTGGLGPTFDDKTLEGIAQGAGRRLKLHGEALKMVEAKYKEYVREGRIENGSLTPARRKMAKIPEGGEPLINPVGTAVGVKLVVGDTTVVALPGVPVEMEAIVQESVLPLLRKAAGSLVFYEASLDVTGIVESELAPHIDEAMKRNPYVYVKSHPKGEERVPHIELHFSTTAENGAEAKQRVGRALVQLSTMIEESGGNVQPTGKKKG